jgi:hypothetical protein
VLQILNFIPAEEVYGAKSRLVEQVGPEPLSGVASLGGVYQIATAIIALLFIFILVRHFALFRHLIESSISKQKKNTDNHIFSSELKNIKIFTSLVGTLLLSLLVMRLGVMEEFPMVRQAMGSMSVWSFGALSFVAIFATILFERGMLHLVGIISEHEQACINMWHIKLLHFSVAILVVTPFAILALLTDGVLAVIAFYISVAVSSVSLVLFVKDSFLFFNTQRFSIFHWILYLCALEIFPLSLLLAPMVR